MYMEKSNYILRFNELKLNELVDIKYSDGSSTHGRIKKIISRNQNKEKYDYTDHANSYDKNYIASGEIESGGDTYYIYVGS